MPSTPEPGAVLYVKSLERVARFYEQLLSLTALQAQKDHIVLGSEAFQLILQAIPQRIAESIVISDPPEVREETPIKLLLPVSSIAHARSAAPKLGGHVGPVEREWEFMGLRVCDGVDPEGNVFQLRQAVP